MSYNLKTLIVFDTNTLRNTEAGKVAYNSFSFGKAYNMIDEFIYDKKLNDHVTLAVSTMVIVELKQQKQKQYQEDIQQLKDIVRRLTGLPHIPEGSINIPAESFDYSVFIEEKANSYIQTKGINTLAYKDEHAPSMLKNMLAKVVGLENGKSPFARSGKFNDAGFKDSVIWETLMHYEKVIEFDKVIFLSKDGDYKQNCIDDFKTKWNRHIEIEKDENKVIAELEADYQNFIEFKRFYDYTDKEYFQKYIQQQLNDKTYIQLDDEYRIENYRIDNYCTRVLKNINDDTQEEEYIIHSSILIFFTKARQKEQIPVDVSVTVDEQFEIYDIIFDPGVY